MDENVAHPPGPQPPPQAVPVRRKSRVWVLLALLLLLALAVYLLWPKFHEKPAAAKGKGGKGGGGGAVQVVGARARTGNIGIYDNGLGAVTPIYTVTLKSRVDGELMSVNYHEGDMVKKGDILIQIDPRPYEAALTQAEGNLIRDQAMLDNARIDLTRYQTLVKTHSIPEQQLATQAALVKQDEGVVRADEGTVAAAKVNVIYTTITAPISGRVGLRLVDPGNIVQSSDSNGLVVITQIDPISVLFTISEDQIPAVVRKTRAGQKLSVDAYDREMKNKLASGTLDTIDNQIDQTTGTVRLRALFPNPNGALFANQFVNARLLVETHRNIVLLQSAAIQRNTSSIFVYLVKPDSTVTLRTITTGATEGNDTEITSGLNAGDVAVQSGADKLEENTKVAVQIAGEKSANPAPATTTQPPEKKSGAKKK
jgi:multidrug efflux system membrane fusion protein